MKSEKWVENQIAELRKSMEHLPKTPDVMTKVEMIEYYTKNSRIDALQEVISNQKPHKKTAPPLMEQLQAIK